jgi:hypothetical protein
VEVIRLDRPIQDWREYEVPLESAITKSIMTALKKAGCFVAKRHGGYGVSGEPDLEVLVPTVHHRYPVHVDFEIKQPGKHMTPLQNGRAMERRKYGAIVVEVHCVEEAMDVITALKGAFYED